MASLYNACQSVARYKEGGTFNIGGYDIDIEYYNQQSIQDDLTYGDLVIGDDDESKIVLFADSTITIPEGWTLTPNKPKKSLVIFCNNLVNNGTISMYQKAPNVLPHDFYIIQGSIIGLNRNLVIPAYANNQVPASTTYGTNGNNGNNRNCGSGGTGGSDRASGSLYNGASGSGYAFGGGAGSGGCFTYYSNPDYMSSNVDSVYPMRASDGGHNNTWNINSGGVGNPPGKTYGSNGVVGDQYYPEYVNAFGCGGRIIIFCCNFTNNGTITVNGTDTISRGDRASNGGASGAGAVDVFYHQLNEQGTITANGGASCTVTGSCAAPGKGGNGSITLTQWSLDKIIKEERKKFTKNNWIYLMNNYSQRLKDEVI